MAEAAAKGEVIVVRYADDLVLGFEHREDAERFSASSGSGMANSAWSYTQIKRD